MQMCHNKKPFPIQAQSQRPPWRLQQSNMSLQHSWQQRWFPYAWHSMIINREPSMPDPLQCLDEQGNSPGSNDLAWGHQLGVKHENMIRVVLQNMAGISQGSDGDIKLDSLRSFMMDNQVDVAALTELNIGTSFMTNTIYQYGHRAGGNLPTSLSNMIHIARFTNQAGWQSW